MAAKMDYGNNFNSEFWADDFQVDFECVTGPLVVASMIQANEHVPANSKLLYENATSIVDSFYGPDEKDGPAILGISVAMAEATVALCRLIPLNHDMGNTPHTRNYYWSLV